jgi:hypothetical protein
LKYLKKYKMELTHNPCKMSKEYETMKNDQDFCFPPRKSDKVRLSSVNNYETGIGGLYGTTAFRCEIASNSGLIEEKQMTSTSPQFSAWRQFLECRRDWRDPNRILLSL